jgi:hypothetical protein
MRYHGMISLGELGILPSLRVQAGSGTDPVYYRMGTTEGVAFPPKVGRSGVTLKNLTSIKYQV